MEKSDPCQELLEKTYGEVISNEPMRKQLWKCLNRAVFEIDGLRFSHDEYHIMAINLPEEFFDKPVFLWNGRLSDKRLMDFYKTLMTLQKRFELDFIIDSCVKPSPTNLQLKLKFPMKKFLKERKQAIDDTTITDLLQHLGSLWQDLGQRLRANYKWDVL